VLKLLFTFFGGILTLSLYEEFCVNVNLLKLENASFQRQDMFTLYMHLYLYLSFVSFDTFTFMKNIYYQKELQALDIR
jgi:hypothetical protein